METKRDIEKIKSFTNAQVYRLVAFFVAGAVILTLIYAEFRYLQKEKEIIEDRLDKKIKIITSNEIRISKLEQKGSDEK